MREQQMIGRMLKGKCSLCGGSFTKAEMTKHLKSCKQGKGISETLSGRRSPQKIKSLHLVVEGRYLPEYWMHLEVLTNAKLWELDNFLRDIWLECCGHMSAFTIEGLRYSSGPREELDERSMDVVLGEVLIPGMKFYYEYDFGTTTELLLRVVSGGEGKIEGEFIWLLARNDPPLIPCDLCGKIATQACAECSWSDGGWLCDKCASEHRCDEEMLLPVVNSPRVGMCGYTG